MPQPGWTSPSTSRPRASLRRPIPSSTGRARTGARLNLTTDAREAVSGVDAVVTDCWVLHGVTRMRGGATICLQPYQVNRDLMSHAARDALFMHCLPAHRGEEVTDEIMDGPHSVVFDEAENRLHAQKRRSGLVLRPGGTGLGGRMTATLDGHDDAVLPFAVEPLDLRGRVVRLGPAIDTLIRRHAYPEAVARVLGEAAALTALLGSSLKFEGRFQMQTRTDGPIEMIVVDFDTPDRIRAFHAFR